MTEPRIAETRSRLRMPPWLAVGTAQQIAGRRIVRDEPRPGIIAERASDLHGEIGQDATCG